MRTKFLLYAIVVALVTTILSWSSMFGSVSKGGGNSWRSHSYGGGGYSGGGSHK